MHGPCFQNIIWLFPAIVCTELEFSDEMNSMTDVGVSMNFKYKKIGRMKKSVGSPGSKTQYSFTAHNNVQSISGCCQFAHVFSSALVFQATGGFNSVAFQLALERYVHKVSQGGCTLVDEDFRVCERLPQGCVHLVKSGYKVFCTDPA